MLKQVEWEEFKICDLFEISHYGKQRSQNDLQRKGKSKYNFVMQNYNNNGVIEKVPKQIGNCFNLIPENSISAFTHLNKVYYQEEPFYSKQGSNVYTLRSSFLNKQIAKFIISTINSVIGEIEYGKNTASRLKNYKIQLPILKNGELNFEFMKSFIAELEAELITELEVQHLVELKAYFLATGLKNHRLTIQEQNVLDDFKNKKIKWREFRLEELFNIATGRDVIIGRVLKGNIPLVSHQHTNNGITKRINKLQNRRLFNYKTTLPLADRGVFLATAQNEDFHIGTRVKALTFKDGDKGLKNRLFFVTSINKLQMLFTEYSSNATDNLPNLNIQLPIKNKKPDYEKMNILISAIQKIVIKDVVLNADRKIEATKKAVNN